MTDKDGGRLYSAGSWKPGPKLGPGAPYDSTTELAVLGQSNGIYRLVELATGRELAKLEDPEQNSGPAALTEDGTKLVTRAKNGMRVWDLRRIREGLMELGLDWEAPCFAPEKKPPSPLQVTVDLGALDPAVNDLITQSDVLRRKGDLAGALAVIEKAHARAPDDPSLNNYLAWLLATCPDPKQRDAQRSVRLAQKAVDAAPNVWGHWRTLGVAQHVAGDDAAAVKSLTRSLELHKDGESFDYFPLAAAYQRLGHKGQARKWYDSGVKWADTNKHPYMAELTVLRAEAEACLGIGQPPDKK